MITIDTTTGKVYAVTTTNGCDVATTDGVPICSVEAGAQGYFVAPSNEVTVSDDAALVTATFKCALRTLRLLAGGSKLLPAGYSQIAYLESSTGGEYLIVDTLVDDNFGLIYDFEVTKLVTNGFPLDNQVLAASSWRSYRITGYNGCRWYNNAYTMPEEGRVLWKCNFLNNRKISRFQYDPKLFTEKDLPIQNAIPINSFCFCGVFQHRTDGSVARHDGAYIRIHEIQMSYGSDIVRALVPAFDNTGKPCMFDTVSKQSYYNAGSGYFIVGIDATAQIKTLLRNLPDLTGQEAKTLQIRLADSIRTEELEAYITNEGNNKNWLISHAA